MGLGNEQRAAGIYREICPQHLADEHWCRSILFERLDTKIERIDGRINTRLDRLIEAQADVRERIAVLEDGAVDR